MEGGSCGNSFINIPMVTHLKTRLQMVRFVTAGRVNFSNNVIACAVCSPAPCQHPCPSSRAGLSSSLLEVELDPLVFTTASSGCDVGHRTWNSWFKDVWIEKRRRRPDCWGEKSLVEMARWVSALWGRKEALGQEETRKFGIKIAESLVLNGAIIQLLEELRVCMCAHSYVVLNCRSTNNFFSFFQGSPVLRGWIGALTWRQLLPAESLPPSWQIKLRDGGLMKERRWLLWLGCEL